MAWIWGAVPSQELCARKSRIVLSGVHEFHGVLIKGFVRCRVYIILNLNPSLRPLPPDRPPPPRVQMIISNRPAPSRSTRHPPPSTSHDAGAGLSATVAAHSRPRITQQQ